MPAFFDSFLNTFIFFHLFIGYTVFFRNISRIGFWIGFASFNLEGIDVIFYFHNEAYAIAFARPGVDFINGTGNFVNMCVKNNRRTGFF